MTDEATHPTAAELLARLSTGAIISLQIDAWNSLADEFELVDEVDTMTSGMIWLYRGETGLFVVECPSKSQRAIRSFPSEQAARVFVADRLATYERMWDGCGCKIDYFG